MATKTITIRESAYHALKSRKRSGESFSDVILRVTGVEDKCVADFLQGLDPGTRAEIAGFVTATKKGGDHIRPRKMV